MKRQWPIYLLVGAIVGFGFGLYQLFRLRYESGDVYPEYSSLRADPLGTSALYEALGRSPGVSVERDYSVQNQLPRGRSVTYLHLAATKADWTSMDSDLLREIEGFVSSGGRLVVAFLPEADQRGVRPLPAAPSASPGKKKPRKTNAEEERERRRTSPQAALGFELASVARGRGDSGGYSAVRVRRQTDLPLPEELSWHSSAVFTNLAGAWRTVYGRPNSPVLIERELGRGSIVLATDCYFLSNEAMLKDREPELLAWIVGPSRKVLFDEAHLGVLEQEGIAMLMRKYRLHGFVVVLLLLAALFVWQNISPFPPVAPGSPSTESVTGKEAGAGFTNLLRRNIAPADLLRLCFEEWTKSLAHNCSLPIERIDAAQAVVEKEDAHARTRQDPVGAYREIALALKGKKR